LATTRSRRPRQLRPLIGSQLQDSALPDRLRVAEAVDLFSTARARDGGELLEQFGLAQRRRSAFASLSGGERQRLFLVLALLNRPRLVILDELTQGLDPAARRNVWAAVRQLHDEGTTVLLVTHEMDEAEVLCGRVVAMREGRVLDAGAPADLVDRHAGTATIRFSLPDAPALLLDQVRRLDGVREVERAGARVTVRGARPVIAHVGAAWWAGVRCLPTSACTCRRWRTPCSACWTGPMSATKVQNTGN
jgi:ABC-2 type transport system ATP-binding protein